MSWSTREIAALAGVTLRTVRHYHEVGLLEEPRRRANGYKQYDAAHLERIVRIKQLSELGFSLPQIARMGDGDQPSREAVLSLHAELSQNIAQLQQARCELRHLLAQA